MRKRLHLFCFMLSMFFGFHLFGFTNEMKASPKEASIVTLDKKQDLKVMFTFDKETVDITFISPSGKEKKAKSKGVTYEKGLNWATYLIKNAEEGTWSVRYDLKSNTKINYSVIKDDHGIWLQYVKAEIRENEARIKFKADSEQGDRAYSYIISAIHTEDATYENELFHGDATANSEVELQLNIDNLASGEYKFKVYAYYMEGDTKIFDSALSEALTFINPSPSSMPDYKVILDLNRFSAEILWDNGNASGYHMKAFSDDQLIYSTDLPGDVNRSNITFSGSTKKLKVQLSPIYDKKRYTYREKIISFGDSFLRMENGKVVSGGEAVFDYKVLTEGFLTVKVGESEVFKDKVTKVGKMGVPLQEGRNVVFAELELEDGVVFRLDTEVYFDNHPPEILLYENLNNKHFVKDTVQLIGKVKDCETLTINGETVFLKENGEFDISVSLKEGENPFHLEAEDQNGNLSKMVLNLWKGERIVDSGVEIKKNVFIKYLPLIAGLFGSLFLALASFTFISKKRGRRRLRLRLWYWIALDILLGLAELFLAILYWKRHQFNHSLEYITLAEKSMDKAVKSVEMEELLKNYLKLGGNLLIISLLLTFILILIRKKLKKKVKGEEENVL